jgi:hypothetical protein
MYLKFRFRLGSLSGWFTAVQSGDEQSEMGSRQLQRNSGGKMVEGQKVEIEIDAYPDQKFREPSVHFLPQQVLHLHCFHRITQAVTL